MKFIKQYIEEKYFLQTNGRVTLKHVCDDAGLDGVKVCINNVETGLFISQAEYDEWVDSMFDEIKSENEEKLTYKVAPRFKVGDWVVYNNANVYQVKKIEYIINMFPRYELENIDGDKFSIPFTSDYNLRNWNMQDAKDGDVLAIGDEYFLFKNKKGNTSTTVYISHCFCDSAGAFRVTNGMDEGGFLSMENGIKACPATKEQCNILFHKMKEAGYEWDVDKKEMRRIEQKPIEKSEDELMRKEAISIIKQYNIICEREGDKCYTADRVIAWLETQGEMDNNNN